MKTVMRWSVGVALVVLSCARPASADVISYQFDFTVTNLMGTSPAIPIAPDVAALFPLASGGSLLLSWDDTTPGFDMGGGLKRFSQGFHSVGIRGAGYSSDVSLYDYNYLFQDNSASFHGFGEVFGGASTGGGFSPYFFEFATHFAPGTLPGMSLPDTLPGAPDSGSFQISFGTGVSEHPQIIEGRINSISKIPEPTTCALLGMGLVGLALKRRRRA